MAGTKTVQPRFTSPPISWRLYRRDLYAASGPPIKRRLIVIDNAPRQHGTALVRAVVLTLIAAAAQFGGADARAASLKQEQDCLALALYWEARGEGRRGMLASYNFV